MQWLVLGSLLAFGLVSSASCGGDSSSSDAGSPPDAPLSCVAASTYAACTPLYEPKYDEIFARTFKVSCASSGVSCHASTGRQGGINFDDADEAYRNIVTDTRAVRPSNAECSPLVFRIAATDGRIRMPPGRSLDPGEQCAIARWIANGAKR